MRPRGGPLLALLLSLLAQPVLAGRLDVREVPCPMTGTSTRVHLGQDANRLGGWDTDGAWYSSAENYRRWALASCPDAPLVLLATDMARGLSPQDKQALEPLLATLPPPDPDDIPSQYAQAARCYRAMGRSRWFVARLYLQGAWVARDAVVGTHLGIQGPRDVHDRIDALEARLATGEDPELRLEAAQLAHRGGYPARRDQHLDALFTADPPPALARQAKALRTSVIGTEAELTDMAIVELTALVEGESDTSRHVRLLATYVLADLHRRRGNKLLALPLYKVVAQDPGAVAELAELARLLARELQGEDPFREPPSGPLTPPRVALP